MGEGDQQRKTRPLQAGDRIGPWKLQETLGRGGQGEAWRVKPWGTRRSPPRALKVCLSRDEKELARFASEISLLKNTQHPNVMPIHEADTFDASPYGGHVDAPFYTMELGLGPITSPALRADARQLLSWFLSVCEAVQALHSRTPQVLHRDIKPSNLLVLAEGRRAVIADFGIAVEVPNMGILTATHEVVGPLVYRAPEVAHGQPATVKSDIYSLGRVLECLVTGQEPSSHMPALVHPGQLGLTKRAADALNSVVARASAYDPAKRFGSVQDLMRALPDLVVDVAPLSVVSTLPDRDGSAFTSGRQRSSSSAVPFRPGGELGRSARMFGPGEENTYVWAGSHDTPFAYCALEEPAVGHELSPLALTKVVDHNVPLLQFGPVSTYGISTLRAPFWRCVCEEGWHRRRAQ